MDEKDEFIINTLLKNSRTPMTHMAKDLGMTEAGVRKRINKLERLGAIRSYTAIIDPYFVGYNSVALVGIDTTPERLLNVFSQVKEMPQIRYAALTTGDHMIMFEIWCKTPDELNLFLSDIEKMEGVRRICPAIFLKQVE
jgi:Lrp/AsnC family transcriptional regulator for asnA, asnC and gidA